VNQRVESFPTRLLAESASVSLLNSLGRESTRLRDAHWAKAVLAGVFSKDNAAARQSDGGKESPFEEAWPWTFCCVWLQLA
jgi:hypothetical protein